MTQKEKEKEEQKELCNKLMSAYHGVCAALSSSKDTAVSAVQFLVDKLKLSLTNLLKGDVAGALGALWDLLSSMASATLSFVKQNPWMVTLAVLAAGMLRKAFTLSC